MTLQPATRVRQPVLLAADEPGLCALIERFAADLEFDVVSATGASTALQQIADVRPQLALVDLEMPGMNGLETLRAIRDIDPTCSVVLMASHDSPDTAVDAVRLGALDYLTKPVDLERLRGLLLTAEKSLERRATLLQIDADAARRFQFHGMIGRSAPMQELFDAIRRLAPHARAVMITGETGTGKELVARALHAVGPRRDGRFVTANCSGAVDSLFETDLAGDTLFLDEIGELPPDAQTRLLGAVQSGAVHAVAATNRDLRSEVAAGRFRGDLFHRLGAVALRLTPLRQRPDDIPLLTAAFIRDCAARLNRSIVGVTTAAERALLHAPWDGNVRELRNVVERACLLTDARVLSEREIVAALSAASAGASGAARAEEDSRLSSAQRTQIERVLRRAGGNKTEAARQLGISRRALYRWLERLDLGGPASRAGA